MGIKYCSQKARNEFRVCADGLSHLRSLSKEVEVGLIDVHNLAEWFGFMKRESFDFGKRKLQGFSYGEPYRNLRFYAVPKDTRKKVSVELYVWDKFGDERIHKVGVYRRLRQK